jgi:putative addiction module component (TIGR02574 family)
MSMLEPIKDQLRSLSAAERADLAHFLIGSLDEAGEPNAPTLWDRELEKRVSEIDSGTATGAPAVEVFRAIREKHS